MNAQRRSRLKKAIKNLENIKKTVEEIEKLAVNEKVVTESTLDVPGAIDNAIESITVVIER